MSDGLPVVVIDPGHGGDTPVGGSSPNNATGPNGLLEKNVTLDLAQRVASLITSMGNAQVIMTRTTDTNLALIDRAKVAKDNNAAVFLSIHLNGWSDPNVDGTEVWIAPGANAQSHAFAETLLTYLVAVTGVRNRGVRKDNLGVLKTDRHAPNTAACLAEIAFLTNPAQARQLAVDGYRQLLAQAMADAILQHIPAPVAVTHSMASVGVGGSSDTIPSYVSAPGYRDGGHFSSREATSSTLDTITLGFGVPGGKITQPFYRDAEDKVSPKRLAHHFGMDVSLSNESGGGAEDPRRGLPVYATIKPALDIDELNAVRVAISSERKRTGLGIQGKGMATLQNALVLHQHWQKDKDADAYGGVLGLACRYKYTKSDDSVGLFTIYIEYLHLITPDFLPKDGDDNIITADAWKATGKGIGFGPQMQNNTELSAAQLIGGDPLLVGYLGATKFPHVHIHANYADGEKGYLNFPRFDPTAVLASSTTLTRTQAVESLGLRATNGYGNRTHAQSYVLEETGTDSLTHDLAMCLLNAAGITVNSSGNCSDKNNKNCTSLEGVKCCTIAGIIGFKKQSGCDVTVTGGTETGHTNKGSRTHAKGYKLDIRKDEPVTNFIHKHFTPIEKRGDGSPQYKDENGNIYADESEPHPKDAHWDITFMC